MLCEYCTCIISLYSIGAVVSLCLLLGLISFSNVLVYRLGGDSTDVSIVHLQGGLYRILGNTSSRDVAGSKFTNVLADYLAQEFFK